MATCYIRYAKVPLFVQFMYCYALYVVATLLIVHVLDRCIQHIMNTCTM